MKCYDKVLSIPAQYPPGGTLIVNNAKNYFEGYPALKSLTVKGLSVTPLLGDTISLAGVYLTLVNYKGQNIIYNYPIVPLTVSNNQFQNYRIKQVYIENIDLQKSYYIETATGGTSPYTNTPFFWLNLYY